MKLASYLTNPEAVSHSFDIEIPFGLIGLSHLRRFEVTTDSSSEPFVQMKSISDEELHFLAIIPRDVIPNYEIELHDEDVEELGLTDPEDALIYNIATVHSTQPQYVTVNLIGPLIVNRRTLIGKQVIIANSKQHSTRHALIDERPATTVCAA